MGHLVKGQDQVAGLCTSVVHSMSLYPYDGTLLILVQCKPVTRRRPLLIFRLHGQTGY